MLYILGAAQSSLANVERYDPKTNTWSAVSQMLTRRSLLNLAALEGTCLIHADDDQILYSLSKVYCTVFKKTKIKKEN